MTAGKSAKLASSQKRGCKRVNIDKSSSERLFEMKKRERDGRLHASTQDHARSKDWNGGITTSSRRRSRGSLVDQKERVDSGRGVNERGDQRFRRKRGEGKERGSERTKAKLKTA